MTTARTAPHWVSATSRSVDRTTVVVAAGAIWLLLLLVALALLLI